VVVGGGGGFGVLEGGGVGALDALGQGVLHVGDGFGGDDHH
jgi:hypothetical protein